MTEALTAQVRHADTPQTQTPLAGGASSTASPLVRVVESPMVALALRLSPGMDVKEELERLVKQRGIKAASVLTCVGSLRDAIVRFANKPNGTMLKGPLEIVSLIGTLGEDGLHLHIAVSDRDGVTTGGHVMPGCRVFTTAEIVLGILTEAVFTREIDSATGFKELVITPRSEKK
jgi:predicted DNA-binding protein with PD1-like motif